MGNCCGILGISSSNLGPDTDDPASLEFLVKCWWSPETGHDSFRPHPVSSLFKLIVPLYPTIQGWRQRSSRTLLIRFAKFVFGKTTFRLVQHTDNTSPVLWIRTHNTATSVITPQSLGNFKSHDFKNYPFLDYILVKQSRYRPGRAQRGPGS